MRRKTFLFGLAGLVMLPFCKPKPDIEARIMYTAYLYEGTLYLTNSPATFHKEIIEGATKVALYSYDYNTNTLTKIKELK
jgi:hypothetical protein